MRLSLFILISLLFLSGANAQTLKTWNQKDYAYLQVLELHLEDLLKEKTGKSFHCTASLPMLSCVNIYLEVLKLPLDKAAALKSKKAVYFGEGANFSSTDLHVKEKSFELITANLAKTMGIPAADAVKKSNTEVTKALQWLKQYNAQVNSKTDSCDAKKEKAFCDDKTAYYDKLFDEPEFRTTIVLGYEDEEAEGTHAYQTVNLFYANYNYEGYLRKLTTFYGFTLKSKTATEANLERAFFYRGVRKTAKIHLVNSTVRCPGETGFTAVRSKSKDICEEQKKATQYALSTYGKALKDDPLVIYTGHSRFGKGPDFGAYFDKKSKLPIRAGALDTMKFTQNSQIFYLNSCSSKEHFSEAVNKKDAQCKNDDITVVTNDQEAYGESDVDIELINGIIESRCPDEIRALMNRSKDSQDYSRVHMDGF